MKRVYVYSLLILCAPALAHVLIPAQIGFEPLESPIDSPLPPIWPAAFEMQYTIELPYIQTIQIVGLK